MKINSIVTLGNPGVLKQPHKDYPEFAVIIAKITESTYPSWLLDRNLYGYTVWDERLLKEVGFFEGAKNTEQANQPDSGE